MSWLSHLQPNLILGGPILGLTPEILQNYEIKGLVLDVDETLVPLRSKEASAELREWVEQIRQVVSVWLVSNNLSESRIRSIANSLDLPYILAASKPSRRKLKKAAAAMNLPVQEVAMVGESLVHRRSGWQSSGHVHHSRRTDGRPQRHCAFIPNA